MSGAPSVVPLVGAKNVQLRVAEGGAVVYVYVDLARDYGASSTGKSVVIASSCGNKALGQSSVFLGLNVFVKSLAQRVLTAEATAALRTGAFVPVGEHCAWRIVAHTKDDDDVDGDNKTTTTTTTTTADAAAAAAGDEAVATLLCVRLDLASAEASGGRPAGSGKSVLLATTSGNKAVAGTSVMCGLNCYRAVNARVDMHALTQMMLTTQPSSSPDGDAAHDALVPGTRRDLGNGFTLVCRAAREAVIEYTLDARALVAASPTTPPPPAASSDDKSSRRRPRSGSAVDKRNKDDKDNNDNNSNDDNKNDATTTMAVLPPCHVGDVVVSLTLAPPKPKRTRGGGGGDADADGTTTSCGALLLRTAADAAKVRNVVVTCTPADAPDLTTHDTHTVTAATPRAYYTLCVSFDPTCSLGRSASGKSLTVASSGGFQVVGVPADDRNNTATTAATTTPATSTTTRATTTTLTPVCRLNFNAYKSAAPITAADVMQTAQRVLSVRTLDELNTMTLKTAMREILGAMQLSEKHEAMLRDKMCEAIKAVLDAKRKSSAAATTATECESEAKEDAVSSSSSS